MGVVIDTEHKVTDKHGSGRHGFTAGDGASNAGATELSATWCDNVSEEINNTIADMGGTVDGGNDAQLTVAVQTAAIQVAPRNSGLTEASLVMDADLADASPQNTWAVYRKTGRVKDLTGGGAAFSLVDCDFLPDNSYCFIRYVAVICRADDSAVRSSEEGVATFYRGTNAATSALGTNSANYNESVGAFPTVQMAEDANGYPYLYIDPSGLSGVNDWNFMGQVEVTVVTES